MKYEISFLLMLLGYITLHLQLHLYLYINISL